MVFDTVTIHRVASSTNTRSIVKSREMGAPMRQFFPVEDLARDERFVQTNMAERLADTRNPVEATPTGRKSSKSRAASNRLTPDRPDASERARGLMHGIMVGEIQALEGAGRTGAPSLGRGTPRRN